MMIIILGETQKGKNYTKLRTQSQKRSVSRPVPPTPDIRSQKYQNMR